jgi:hypothetical protein
VGLILERIWSRFEIVPVVPSAAIRELIEPLLSSMAPMR